MSYLFSRSLAGFTTLSEIYTNSLQVQTSGVGGFSIYSNDPTQPLFTVDGTTGTITTTGTLNVLGTAVFNTIDISELKSGLLELASTNTTSDDVDIGIFGNYNPGSGAVLSAIYRNSADTDRRWFIVDGIVGTPPLSNMPTPTTSNFAGLVVENVGILAGSVSTPSLYFYEDIDTGLYLIGNNNLGIAVGGAQVASLTSNTFSLGTNTLRVSVLNTANDVASITPGATSGTLLLQATGTADKWYHSLSTNPASAWAGNVYSFGTTSHYFVTNNAGQYTISRSTQNVSLGNPPDFRNTVSTLFSLDNNYIQSSVPIYLVNNGTAAAPGYTFANAPSSGMYWDGTGISLSAASVQAIQLTSTYVSPKLPVLGVNGTLSAPSYSFFGASTTGIFRDNSLGVENISISLGGTSGGLFRITAGQSQLSMPITSATYPSITFGTTGAGIWGSGGYVNVATNSQNVWTFGGRSGPATQNHQSLNGLDILPNGSLLTACFSANDTRINTIKGNTANIEGYNIIDKSVLGLYRFNNFSSIGADLSSQGRNATVVGPPLTLFSFSDGVILKKYLLDFSTNSSPTNQYLSLTSYIASYSVVNDFSISFWFLVSTTNPSNSTIINFKNTTTLKNITLEILDASDSLRVTVDSDSITTLQFNTQAVAIKDGNWHHCVLLLGSSGNKLYLDNVQLLNAVTLNYTSGGNGVPTADYATNTLKDLTFNRIIIGGEFDGVSFTKPYLGYLYSVYFSARNLTVAEINALYVEGSISTYALDVAMLNVASQSISGQLTIIDGTATTPAYSFSSELNTGLFRAGAGNLGISILGTQILSVTSTGLSNTGIYRAGNGTVAAPAYSFGAVTNMGIYNASGQLAFSQGGTKRLGIDTNITVASATDSTQLLIPNGTATAPSLSFISEMSGLYRITTNDIGISIAGTQRLAINSTRLLSSNVVYLPNGTDTSPAIAASASTNTGIYFTGSNNGIAITNNGVANCTFDNPSIPRAIFPVGSLAVPSITFSGALNYGIFYGSSTMQFVANGVLQMQINTSGVTITTLNATTFNTSSVYTNSGSNTMPTLGFIDDITTGLFYRATSILCTTTGGIESSRIHAGASSSYYVFGNITNASTYNGDNVLKWAGLNGKQSSSFDFTVLAERFWSGSNSELLLFKNIASGDRIRYRGYSHVFQTPSANETYSSLGDNNTAMTINQGVVSIGDSSSSTATLQIPSGSVSNPSLATIASTNSGFYYSSTLRVAQSGVNVWTWGVSGSATFSYNPLNISANGTTTSVLINSSKIAATSTQTLLNSLPILEYNFTNTLALETDTSINRYSGSILGTVSSVTSVLTLTDSTGTGLINYFAAGFTYAANGILSAQMPNMATTLYMNVNMLILFNDITTSTPANCWTIYGNSSDPTTNYFRLYLTTGGVLNIDYFNSAFTLRATYSSISANIWYRIEMVCRSTGNLLLINGTQVILTYTVGSSALALTPIASFTSTTNLRTLVGGGVNSYNSPNCYIAYFSVIQTGSSDAVSTPYRQQVHELHANKLVVSGYPYNSSSTQLNEGFYAISNKVGQLQWDNSIQLQPSTVQLNKQITTSGIVSQGSIKYNYQTSSATTLNLVADTTGHYWTLTGGTVTVTLPTGSSQRGREFVFYWSGTPGSLTVNTSGSDTFIGGAATISITTNMIIKLVYDGVSNWLTM